MNPFKELFLLDPRVVFLNHGSFGACPRPVFQAYQAWQRRLERQPVLFLGREFRELERQAREALADFSETKPDNLVFIPNATFGVNAVARSLNLGAEDEILTTDQEYGACNHAWDFVSGKSGAKVIRCPIDLPKTGQAGIIVDRLWQGLTPRTKAIYVSHITSPTALRLPVERICDKARQVGILSIIDGAHAPGQIPLNLEAIGADFYVGNLHKWALSPKGAAFLYARPEVQGLMEPLIVSWGYRAAPEKTTGSTFLDYYLWTGTLDPAAYLSVPAAIRFMVDYHWDQVRRRCHELLHPAIQRICELVGLEPPYPLDSDFYHQMGVAPLPADTDLEALKARLYADYNVEVPLTEWNGQKFVRISVQAYNSQEDLEILYEGLKTLLPRVRS
jgi:isopenicillin-N epimerase